jgi:hypothetical protein
MMEQTAAREALLNALSATGRRGNACRAAARCAPTRRRSGRAPGRNSNTVGSQAKTDGTACRRLYLHNSLPNPPRAGFAPKLRPARERRQTKRASGWRCESRSGLRWRTSS